MTADAKIRKRLERIYEATTWFEQLSVRVDEGVVFLEGVSSAKKHAEWATSLAQRTEGVVGVANRLQIDDRVDWSVAPAWESLRELSRDAIKRLPLFAFGLIALAVTMVVAWITNRIVRRSLEKRLSNRILTQVASTLAVAPVALIGIYIFLQVAGLTRLAATVLGGTGVAGLVVGIAFRDVAENFLASVLISIKRPFRLGHLIEVEGKKGYVQSVTTRGTLLMTLDGNYVHIPNAEVYKSTVYNFSANPRTRFDFSVGIDYEDSASAAQDVCLTVLREHAAVLDDPEPLVLVESLGASSVVLRIYFWVNTHEHSGSKVSSSVLRKVKLAIEGAGLTMPDDAREVIFPRSIPVHIEREKAGAASVQDLDTARQARKKQEHAKEAASTAAEGGLKSESDEIQDQARSSDQMDLGPDLVGADAE